VTNAGMFARLHLDFGVVLVITQYARFVTVWDSSLNVEDVKKSYNIAPICQNTILVISFATFVVEEER